MEHLSLATYPITNDCNLACPWCAAHIKSQPIFNTGHVLGALSRIRQPIHGVALTGGEPFSRPDILEVKAELEAAGHRVLAITNGTLHEHIFEFVEADTLFVALSVHNPSLFPAWVVAKKAELVQQCRERGVKIMAALFSVESAADIKTAAAYILEHRDVFHTATISTVYRKDMPSMAMADLLATVMALLPAAAEIVFTSPGKTIVMIDDYPLVLRRSPTRAEYDDSYAVPGCLFLAWDGEFYPVALAQYLNEEALA